MTANVIVLLLLKEAKISIATVAVLDVSAEKFANVNATYECRKAENLISESGRATDKQRF
jgi:hypothetical protein